jgi:hypothetical protein
MFARIFFGLLFMGLGVLMIKYHYQLKNLMGSWAWAEDKLGSGGTYTAWKLFGLFSILGGLFYMTGTLGNIVAKVAGLFFSNVG